MNRFKQILSGSREPEEVNRNLETNVSNAIVPFESENRQHNNNQSEMQEWEKWIQWQAKLYKRHEDRLWYLRDSISDIAINSQHTGYAISQLQDYIMDNINLWRQMVADLTLPIIQGIKESNFNPHIVVTMIDKLNIQNSTLHQENEELKNVVQNLSAELTNLRNEVLTMKRELEIKFDTQTLEIEATKQRFEEDNNLIMEIQKNQVENTIKINDYNKRTEDFKYELNEMFETMNQALDVAKQRNEEDQEKILEKQNLKLLN